MKFDKTIKTEAIPYSNNTEEVLEFARQHKEEGEYDDFIIIENGMLGYYPRYEEAPFDDDFIPLKKGQWIVKDPDRPLFVEDKVIFNQEYRYANQ